MMKLVMLLLLAGAGYLAYLVLKEKPGEGPQARAGKNAAQPIIAVIESYRSTHATYPPDLDDLAGEGASIPREIHGHPLRYNRHGATFELTFSYTNPLPVHCTYSPERKWTCGYMKG